MNIKTLAAAAYLTLASLAPAWALSLDIVGGQLQGASDVIVGTSSFDVEFLDGTCAALFDGCNQPGDFAFSDETTALDAAQALLDQIFVDVPGGAFDSDPRLTRGISRASGSIIVPFSAGDPRFDAVVITNKPGSLVDEFHSTNPLFSLDTLFHGDLAFARFTSTSTPSAVPLPVGGLLLLSALAGLGALRRGKKRVAWG